MTFRRIANFVLLAVSLCPSMNGQKADIAVEGKLILENAMQTLTAPGPYTRRARLKMLMGARESEGQYSITSTGKAWKEEITVPEYKELRVTSAPKVLIARSLDYEPLPAFLLFKSTQIVDQLQLTRREKIKEIKSEKIGGRVARCVRIDLEIDHGGSRRVCVYADDGALAAVGLTNLKIEFLKYTAFDGKKLPEVVRGTLVENGMKLFELTYDPPVATSQVDLALSQPHNAELGWCADLQPPLLTNRVTPQYPYAARAAHASGTFGAYGVVDVDGQLKSLQTVLSAGTALDKASLEALRQWAYDPAVCEGIPVRTDAVMTVHYSMSQ